MKPEVALLKDQVKTYLIEHKLEMPDKYKMYSLFSGQADQYGISENEFFMDVLRVAYSEIDWDSLVEDPDPRNDKGTHIIFAGQKIYSLKRLGQLLYENPALAKGYFEDMSLIKTHVDAIVSADEALLYAAIYKSEHNFTKRYLKIIYHLNPGLPYKVLGKAYEELSSLLNEAFNDYKVYEQVVNDFAGGTLQIWLNESNPQQANLFAGAKNYATFLMGVYNINPGWPFYIDGIAFSSPKAVFDKALVDRAFCKHVFELAMNDLLFVWFESIGKSDWAVQFAQYLKQETNYTADEWPYAAVGRLIRIVNPKVPVPMLRSSVDQISILNIEAGNKMYLPVKVWLENQGLVKTNFQLGQVISGIGIDLHEYTFFDLDGKKEVTFNLETEPLQLTKDKLYVFDMIIKTEYQSLTIPVQLKVVFPFKIYLSAMAKYGAIGFGILALIRLMIAGLQNNNNWLEPTLIVTDLDNALPPNYFAYVGIFVFLMILLMAIWPIVRKIEKL
jgi:hypothetical protein